LFVLVAVVPAAGQVDQALAQRYFREAQALCERDGGRLWGVSMCGPMVIADAATGTIATSQPAPAGDRPRIIGFVNAPVEWGGTMWSGFVTFATAVAMLTSVAVMAMWLPAWRTTRVDPLVALRYD
jgi:hypothetical protein